MKSQSFSREALERSVSDTFLAAIKREMNGKPDDVPEGWLTVDQWAAKWSLGASQSRRRIKFAMDAKPPLAEMRRFKITVGDRVLAVPHYRPAV